MGTTGRVRQKKIATEAGRESEKKDKQKCDDRFSIERLTGLNMKSGLWTEINQTQRFYKLMIATFSFLVIKILKSLDSHVVHVGIN